MEGAEVLPKDSRNPEHPSTRMIGLIGELYSVERRADESECNAEQRCALRQQHSASIIARIETLLQELLSGALPKSGLGKAAAYLHSQWPKLIRFLDNGAWPLHINLAENAIRPLVGRAQELALRRHRARRPRQRQPVFADRNRHGHRLDLQRYVAHVFRALPAAKTFDDIEPLLSWNVKLG